MSLEGYLCLTPCAFPFANVAKSERFTCTNEAKNRSDRPNEEGPAWLTPASNATVGAFAAQSSEIRGQGIVSTE